MTYIEKRNAVRPAKGESPFGLKEVFFSRTDDRGIILAGNAIFQRVSHYEWEEMLNHPHKVVRHPDMPKAMFSHIWSELKKGKFVGGYIKNLAKDGLYYWVYAVIMPIEGGGFLSTRIKPSHKMLETITALYADLVQTETDTNITPEESAVELQKRLGELGYESYDHFFATALTDELISRDRNLGNPRNRDLEGLRKMVELAEELTSETSHLIAEFEAMKTIPHNLRVIASRLEPTGGPVSTLSQNYGTMSREMSQWFETHVLGENSNFSTIKGAVYNAMALNGMAFIQHECDIQLQMERRSLGGVDVEKERDLLKHIVVSYTQQSKSCFNEVIQEAERIVKACEVMNRHILGLSTTRVMCKIESARLPDAGDALNDIIVQLMTFQNRIKAQLDKIARLGLAIQKLKS